MQLPKHIYLESKLTIIPTDALIIVDIQNDFLPGGALPVASGDEIIEGINRVAKHFAELDNRIIFTQDWHPPNHQSFASVHPGKKPFDEFNASGLGPVLWPNHCVQNTLGANFSTQLQTQWGHLIIRKGFHPSIDSYSTFMENDKITSTGLAGYLKSTRVKRVFLCGLALDYCVFYSALDAREEGFDVVICLDLTRGIDSPPGSINAALKSMYEKNIKFINSDILFK